MHLDPTTVAVVATAVLALALAVVVWRRRPQPSHRWNRHVALQLPGLAPNRWCACGRCDQLAAPGAWLADWHYDPPPGVIPPDKAPDAIPIQGIAWTFGPQGWQPAIVYVVANHQHRPPRGQHSAPQRATAAPSTNGHAPSYRLPDARPPQPHPTGSAAPPAGPP